MTQDLFQKFASIASGTFLQVDRDSNFPAENTVMTLKKSHKDEVRLFILRQLQEPEELRDKLDALAFTYEIHPFEVMDFYENEVARIEKLFNYPSTQ